MLANALPPTLKESIYLSANGSGSTITNKIRLSIYLDILKMKFQLFWNLSYDRRLGCWKFSGYNQLQKKF